MKNVSIIGLRIDKYIAGRDVEVKVSSAYESIKTMGLIFTLQMDILQARRWRQSDVTWLHPYIYIYIFIYK